jgi:hypothetical protein
LIASWHGYQTKPQQVPFFLLALPRRISEKLSALLDKGIYLEERKKYIRKKGGRLLHTRQMLNEGLTAGC